MQISTVRVIIKPGITRQLFEDKKDSGTPIITPNLGETPNGQIFFNTFHGSVLKDAPSIEFKPTDTQDIKLINLKGEKMAVLPLKLNIYWVDEPVEKEVKDEENGHVKTL